MTSRAARLLSITIAALAIGLLGARAGAGRAAAANATPPAGTLPVAAAAAAPCNDKGVASGGAALAQETARHAGLVIVFPEGRVETRCVEFAGDDITGTELLRQSGLPVVFAGFGGLGSAVCRIDDVGCSDPGDCFCQCRGASCAFWGYFALRDGRWSYLNVGPAQRRLQDGDVDGWVWGNGRTGPGDLRGTCPAAGPTVISSSAPPPGTPAPSSDVPLASDSVAPDSGAPPAVRSGTTPEAAGATIAARPTQLVRAAQTPDAGRSEGNAGASTTASGGGAPVGLIAFGVVAGVLILGAGGGLALRRRLGG